VEDGAEVTVVLHRSPKEVFERVAYDHNSSLRVEKNIETAGTNCPVTYLTTIESLKKKSQQQAALQMGQYLNQNSAAPKPYPQPLVPFLLNDSNVSNPLGFSALNLSKIEEMESKVGLEKVAPSLSPAPSSEERVAPSKVESAEPQNKSESAEAKGKEAEEKEKEKGKGSEPKILQLESNVNGMKVKEGGLEKLLN
jgi:hypothetical protein